MGGGGGMTPILTLIGFSQVYRGAKEKLWALGSFASKGDTNASPGGGEGGGLPLNARIIACNLSCSN